MTVRSGFFNSLSNDREYSAEDFSMLFEGVIDSGILESIGDIFAFETNGDMTLTIKSGRAWFNHTWTDNDDDEILSFSDSHGVLDRFDIVVLEINKSTGVRANTLKVVEGTPSGTPELPTLIATAEVIQYPLYYVTIEALSVEIEAADVENRIGVEGGTPYFRIHADYQTSLDAVEAVNATQALDINTLKSEMDAVEAVNATQTSDINAVESEVDALQTENAAQQVEIDALQAMITALQSAVEYLHEVTVQDFVASDNFITARAPGTIHATNAEPGPGERYIVDTGDKASIGV